jgi:hypothetical protein
MSPFQNGLPRRRPVRAGPTHGLPQIRRAAVGRSRRDSLRLTALGDSLFQHAPDMAKPL